MRYFLFVKHLYIFGCSIVIFQPKKNQKPSNCTSNFDELLSIFQVGQFAEDGSFIGQYVPGKLQPPVSPPSTHQLQTVSSKPQLPNGNGNVAPNNAAIATYV